MPCLSLPRQESRLSTSRQVVIAPLPIQLSIEYFVFDSWLNMLYLSIDANFKLKQKDRGFKDPPLSNGLAFMVPNGELQEHLAHCSTKKLTSEVRPFIFLLPHRQPNICYQINTCGSNFNVVTQAYAKYTKGYSVTGVGGVDCAWHGFKRPNGVVDLQKGER